jgi:carbonic anhydrase/acetyltransferase-like protein (isoleucine patch superfamily)
MAVYQLDALTPHIADSAWVADNAQVIGDVHMAADSSVWFSSVVRGDTATIRIGEGTNIQDGRQACDGGAHGAVAWLHDWR